MNEDNLLFLLNRLDGTGANVAVHQADRDGASGVLLVNREDGSAFTIHFSPVEA